MGIQTSTAGSASTAAVSAIGALAAPAHSARLRQQLAAVQPAALDKSMTGRGAVFMLGGFAFFIATAFLGKEMQSAMGSFMLMGFVGMLAGIVMGVRLLNTAGNAKIQNDVGELVAPLLAPGERYLAACTAMRTGFVTWLVGFGKRAAVIFTSDRVFLLLVRGMASVPAALKKADEKVILKVCDLGDASKVAIGGFMFPPALHLAGTKMVVTPEGESAVSLCAHIKVGTNAATIREILARRGA